MKFKILNWNVKLWAVVGVLIVVLAGTGVYMTNQNNDEADTLIVLARANTEGSGIFGDDPDMVSFDEDGNAVFHKDKWVGKIAATPGVTSIQHKILKEALLSCGLKVIAFDESNHPDASAGEVALKPMNVREMSEQFNNHMINAGIAWESIYSGVLDQSGAAGVKHLCWSKEVKGYANHACCMVSANSSFLASHGDATVRFLAGYIEAVDYINQAKEKGEGSEEYQKLVEICLSVTTDSPDVIKRALVQINHQYALTNFVDEYAGLIESYVEAGNITQQAYDKVNQDPHDFAAEHVDGTYLTQAKSVTPGDYPVKTINVAFLLSDLHQVALHVADQLGFFEKYNIKVNLLDPLKAGGAVINALMTGQADIGFAGAPPTVMGTFNTAASNIR